MCVKIAKRMKKYLDMNMLEAELGPNKLSNDPGLELIIEDEALPKDNTSGGSNIQILPKPVKKKIANKESVVDFKNLKNEENPEMLEYNYDTFEYI